MSYIIFILYFSSLSLGSAIEYPDINKSDGWVILNDTDNMWIGYKETPNIDWCRTISILPFTIDKVSEMIEDKGNYYQIFDRVISSKIISDDIVHIRVDMPFPVSDRDYIVSYTINKKNNEISYKFKAENGLGIPINDGCVRLVNAAGEWYLRSVNSSRTEVIYTWNGELRGDFPNWALTRAWKTQGLEMINWLEESLYEKYEH